MQHGSFRWVGLTALVIMFLTTPGLVRDGRPASAAQTATPASSTPDAAAQLDWSACAEAPSPWACATLTVPLDYTDKKSNATLRLDLLRAPASKKCDKKRSILLNFGGPGADGVADFALFAERMQAWVSTKMLESLPVQC